MPSPSDPERLPYAEGFISQATFRDVLAAYRSTHHGFETIHGAYSAIVEVIGDKTLNNAAQMSLIRRIVREYQLSPG
jgi:hypothetical protein